MFGKQTLAIRLIRLNYRPVSLTLTFYLKNSKRKLNYFSVKAKMAIWFLREQNFLLLKCGSVSYLEASIYQGWIWLHIPRPNSCRRQVPHRRRDQQPSVFVLPKDRMQWRIWLEKKKELTWKACIKSCLQWFGVIYLSVRYLGQKGDKLDSKWNLGSSWRFGISIKLLMVTVVSKDRSKREMKERRREKGEMVLIIV